MAKQSLYPVIIGTAGHIDHGKTTLVKALTGQDADRLPEEKARGITIDLGFAHMALPSGQRVAFIDVPGHERFVRNMVAGVHGMDAVVLVVEADEGIMPQTEEHLAILRLLGVTRGLTVITKAGLVDEEMLELVRALVAEAVSGTFLEHAPVVAVDALTGLGMDTLIAELDRLSAGIERPTHRGVVRLPIDRVFSVKGFGTVVTGTLVSGTIRAEALLELVPTGQTVRVRGVQVHNQSVGDALSGQRVAVNLAGVERVEVARGQVLATPGTLRGVDVVVAELELLPDSPGVADKTRVHVHAGTAEALARLYFFDRDELGPGETAYAEIRLESTMPLARHDRLLIRSYSPVVTIGGGPVLEAGVHHRKKEPGLLSRLERLSHSDDMSVVSESLQSSMMPVEIAEVERQSGLTRDELAEGMQADPAIVRLDDRYLWHAAAVESWMAKAEQVVRAYLLQHPVKPGMPRDELKARLAPKWALRMFQAVLAQTPWVVDREWIRFAPQEPALSAAHAEALEKVYAAILDGGLRPVGFEEVQATVGIGSPLFDDILERLFLEGRLLRLEDGLAVALGAYQEGRRLVAEAIRDRGPLSTADLKEVLGISRRHAVLFLELLDRERVTRRVGDSRELVS